MLNELFSFAFLNMLLMYIFLPLNNEFAIAPQGAIAIVPLKANGWQSVDGFGDRFPSN